MSGDPLIDGHRERCGSEEDGGRTSHPAGPRRCRGRQRGPSPRPSPLLSKAPPPPTALPFPTPTLLHQPPFNIPNPPQPFHNAFQAQEKGILFNGGGASRPALLQRPTQCLPTPPPKGPRRSPSTLSLHSPLPGGRIRAPKFQAGKEKGGRRRRFYARSQDFGDTSTLPICFLNQIKESGEVSKKRALGRGRGAGDDCGGATGGLEGSGEHLGGFLYLF